MKKVDVENNRLIIVFKIPKDNKQEFTGTLQLVRTLKGRTFNWNTQSWDADNTAGNIEALRKGGFEFTARAKRQEWKAKKAPEIITDARLGALKEAMPGLKHYQYEGIEFISKLGSGIIADMMGLGKTAQALGIVKVCMGLPALIVCPSAVKLQWQEEIRKWIGKEPSVEILEGEKPVLHNFSDFVVINYDILQYWLPALELFSFNTIIGDEVQKIANDDVQRTQAFLRLANRAERKILLSGTPIKNRTKEFFNALSIVSPKEFNNKYRYLHRYCDPQRKFIHRRGGGTLRVWAYDGLTNWEELREKISKVMIRRTKAEVMPELPKKQKIIVPLQSEKKAFSKYLEAESVFKEWVLRDKEATKEKKTQAVEHLKQLAYLCGRDAIISWINDYIESGNKLVVVVHHKAVVSDLESCFSGQFVTIDGDTKDKDNEKKRFWEDSEIKILIGQYQVLPGMNLQCANAVCFVEMPYTPADAEQAEDRVHRIGQESDSVTIYYLIAEGTINRRIAELLISKNTNIKKLLDGRSNDEFFGEGVMLDKIIDGVKNATRKY